MKRKRRLAVCLLCAMLLTGCSSGEREAGSEPERPDSSVSDRFDAETSQGREGIPLELPQGEVPERTVVRYTWDHPVTVDQGRKLTVRLHCEAEYGGNSWHYSVTSMDLLEGDTLLRTMSIQLANAAAYGQEGGDPDYARDRTRCWDPDGNLIIEDLNFDGIPDLRLLEGTGIVNSRYLCWLWDPGLQKFRFAFSLLGFDVQIDSEKEQIITVARDAQTHYTDYYQYDADGVLRLVDTESVTPEMG